MFFTKVICVDVEDVSTRVKLEFASLLFAIRTFELIYHFEMKMLEPAN